MGFLSNPFFWLGVVVVLYGAAMFVSVGRDLDDELRRYRHRGDH